MPPASAGCSSTASIDRSGKRDLAELRSLQDWFVKFELATVPGVSEVASVGGFVKEYQVLVDPNRLRAYDVPISRIVCGGQGSERRGWRARRRAGRNRADRSARPVTSRISNSLRSVVVFSDNGTPVKLGDVARIVEGPELRRGVVELNGEGEVVGGIVVMRSGENALTVIKAIKQKLDEDPGRPAGRRRVRDGL